MTIFCCSSNASAFKGREQANRAIAHKRGSRLECHTGRTAGGSSTATTKAVKVDVNWSSQRRAHGAWVGQPPYLTY
jgi:hypothetical protein